MATSDLVTSLRAEHLKISDLLVSVRKEGVGSEKGRQLILSAKKMLLAHLNKEDRFLYPVLEEAAEKDESIKNMLSEYVLDMDKISADVMIFFGLYENAENTPENFYKDCNNIIKALTKRITREESVLYKAYDEVVSDQ